MSEEAPSEFQSPGPSTGGLAPHRTELFSRLAAGPFDFDFFHAVRLLECAAAREGQPRIGSSIRAAQDPVRFAQEPSLAFPPSTVAAFDPPGDRDNPDAVWKLVVHFFGLWGPNGPLPLHLTEYARDRQRNHNDPTLVRFVDVFHHRMISLFYRAWAVNQQAVSADRMPVHPRPGRSVIPDEVPCDGPVETTGDEDRFAFCVASLIGRGTRSMHNRDAVPDVAKLHWAGHLAGESRHAEGLESILSSHFGLPVKVIPFAGLWIDLPPENLCILGKSPDSGTIGQTAIVGSRVWDCQSKFRIRLGPMRLDQFTSLLPGRAGNRQLRDWVRNYIGDQMAWEAQLVLAAGEVPKVRLGVSGDLGWSTWLPTAAARPDTEDLILHS